MKGSRLGGIGERLSALGRTASPVAEGGDTLGEVLRRMAEGAPPLVAVEEVMPPETVTSPDEARPHRRELVEAARAVAAGSDPRLAPLLADTSVTDVLVDARGVRVDRGHGLEEVPEVSFTDAEEVRRLAVRMAAACGRRLDDASPMVDGTLASGVRLHAVLPPICPDGALISLRVLRPGAFTIDSLVAGGSITPPLAAVLRALVSARANVLVSGSTGAGKTTLLAALLSLVGERERIICIEETRELRPSHPHVVHLQERARNVQGRGSVSLAELVRAALRMRPDRLVLGECRGAEVREVLTALNTGHEGGWATIHANGVADVPARLMALGALAGMSPETVGIQAAAAFDAVVHVTRHQRPGARALRRVEGIGVFIHDASGLHCSPALSVTEAGALIAGEAWPVLRARLAGHVSFLPVVPRSRAADR